MVIQKSVGIQGKTIELIWVFKFNFSRMYLKKFTKFILLKLFKIIKVGQKMELKMCRLIEDKN